MPQVPSPGLLAGILRIWEREQRETVLCSAHEAAALGLSRTSRLRSTAAARCIADESLPSAGRRSHLQATVLQELLAGGTGEGLWQLAGTGVCCRVLTRYHPSSALDAPHYGGSRRERTLTAPTHSNSLIIKQRQLHPMPSSLHAVSRIHHSPPQLPQGPQHCQDASLPRTSPNPALCTPSPTGIAYHVP